MWADVERSWCGLMRSSLFAVLIINCAYNFIRFRYVSLCFAHWMREASNRCPTNLALVNLTRWCVRVMCWCFAYPCPTCKFCSILSFCVWNDIRALFTPNEILRCGLAVRFPFLVFFYQFFLPMKSWIALAVRTDDLIQQIFDEIVSWINLSSGK